MKASSDLMKRIHRIEGQARGIGKMMEDGRDCPDVVTQIAALRSAVDRLGYQLIMTNLRSCLSDVELPKGTAQDLESSLAALSGMRT